MSKKIVMNDSVREQLTGLLPMRTGSKYTFTPTIFDNAPEEFTPIFSIHQLNNEQVIAVKGMMYEELNNGDKKRSKTKLQAELKRKSVEYLDILKDVVVGWDNLYILDDDNTAELFEFSIDAIEELPEIIRTEIFGEAIKISGFLPKELI